MPSAKSPLPFPRAAGTHSCARHPVVWQFHDKRHCVTPEQSLSVYKCEKYSDNYSKEVQTSHDKSAMLREKCTNKECINWQFAEQLINGVRSIVILRSLSLGSVRVAMTAGTVQPKPMSIGTMLRPESPILRRSLSMKNATLAMYPLSSMRDKKKNSVTIIGKKLKTLPTP